LKDLKIVAIHTKKEYKKVGIYINGFIPIEGCDL